MLHKRAPKSKGGNCGRLPVGLVQKKEEGEQRAGPPLSTLILLASQPSYE